MLLLKIHRYANVFMHPVTDDEAPGYHSIIKRYWMIQSFHLIVVIIIIYEYFNRITYQYLQILLSLGSCLPNIYNNKRNEQCSFKLKKLQMEQIKVQMEQ